MRAYAYAYMHVCMHFMQQDHSPHDFHGRIKQILGALKHPNIIEYREAFEDHSQLCIVMAYAEGGDLSGKIKVCIGCP